MGQAREEKEKRSGYTRGRECGLCVWLGHSFSQNPVSIFARDNRFSDIYVNCDGIVDAQNMFDEMGEQGLVLGTP